MPLLCFPASPCAAHSAIGTPVGAILSFSKECASNGLAAADRTSVSLRVSPDALLMQGTEYTESSALVAGSLPPAQSIGAAT